MKPLDFFRGSPPPKANGPGAGAGQAEEPSGPPTLSSANRLFRTAALVIGIGLGLFLLWAALAPLNRGATAPGRLDVANSRTTVQHLDGGTVSEVLVREGQTVSKDDVLLRMDDQQLRIQVNQYAQQRRQRLIEQAILNAEITGRGVVFPPEVRNATDADTASYRQVQVSALMSRRAARAAEVAALREQIGRLALQAEGLRGQVDAYTAQINLINDEVAGLEDLFARGYAPKTRLLALKREMSSLQGRRGETISAISQAGVQQSEARQRIIQVNARALDAAGQRLAEVEQELALLDDRIAASTLALQRTDVRAPTGGVVLARATALPGAVIKPGDPVMEIVPEGALVVKAQLAPRDVESVAIGSRAQLRFSGLNMQSTPSIEGKVTYISADTLGDPKTQAPYYEVRVAISPEERKKLGAVPLSSGMPVDVMIDAGARTALAYLIQPLVAVFDRSFRE